MAAVKMLVYRSLNSVYFCGQRAALFCVSGMLELARDVIIVFRTE